MSYKLSARYRKSALAYVESLNRFNKWCLDLLDTPFFGELFVISWMIIIGGIVGFVNQAELVLETIMLLCGAFYSYCYINGIIRQEHIMNLEKLDRINNET